MVVNVAGLHAQHLGQSFGVVYRIAYPVDVADVVLITLLNLDIYVYGLLVEGDYRVNHNLGIAIAVLIVLGNEQLLVLLIEVVDELLRTEQVPPVALFVGFLHRPLQLLLI